MVQRQCGVSAERAAELLELSEGDVTDAILRHHSLEEFTTAQQQQQQQREATTAAPLKYRSNAEHLQALDSLRVIVDAKNAAYENRINGQQPHRASAASETAETATAEADDGAIAEC